MAITSVGYDGTVTEAQFASLADFFGADYSVRGTGDWQVQPVAGLDRGFTVAAGVAYGHGVQDTNSAAISAQLGTIASGSRWDLIVLRRNWQPVTGTSSVVVVPGTATMMIPAARLSGPGVLDDQPLALARVTAGNTALTGLMDLRTRATKLYTAADLIAMPDARLGQRAQVGGVEYERVLDATLTPVWQVRSGQIVVEPSLRPTNTTDGLDVVADGSRDLAGSTYNFTPPSSWGTYTLTVSAKVAIRTSDVGKYNLNLLTQTGGGVSGKYRLDGADGTGAVYTRMWGGTCRTALLSGSVSVALNLETLQGGIGHVYDDTSSRMDLTFTPATAV